MSKPALDLRSSLAAWRRRRRLLAAVVATGLVAGAAYAVLVPAQLTSSALILLGSSSAPGRTDASASVTQIAIAMSSTVLQTAGRAMSPPLSQAQVEGRVVVTAPSDQLIQIDASGGTARQAEALAQAMVKAYIATERAAARSVTAASLSDLNGRSDDLQRQLSANQAEIARINGRQGGVDPASAVGVRDAQLSAQLRAQQADLTLRLDKVKSDIATNETHGSTTDAGISLVQSSSPPVGPSLVERLVRGIGFGGLAGLVVGTVLALLLERRDPRLRRRDDIADAVGGRVLAGVVSRPQRSLANWSVLLRSSEAGAVETWSLRQVFRALAQADATTARTPGGPGRADAPRSLTVLTFAQDIRSQALGLQLALFATSSLGLRTHLVTSLDGQAGVTLRAALRAVGTEPRAGLTLTDSPPASPSDGGDSPDGGDPPGAERAAVAVATTDAADDVATDAATDADADAAADVDADLTVVLRAVHPGHPAVPRATGHDVALLVLAPGVATAEDLARLAVAADDAGHSLAGVLIADPDREDRTTGHRDPQERQGQAPLPLRTTGGLLTAVRRPAARRRA